MSHTDYNRVGCHSCGDVLHGNRATCRCGTPDIGPLPTAADVLAFKLRMSGRHDEAEDVERRVA